MKRASFITLTIIGAYSALQATWAVDYPLPPEGSRLIGQNQTYTVQEGDKNLQAIARRFDTAAMLILEANNTIAPVPKPGTLITIPRRCYCRMRPGRRYRQSRGATAVLLPAGRKPRTGVSHRHRFAGTGNSRHGHPDRAKDPQPDVDADGRHTPTFA